MMVCHFVVIVLMLFYSEMTLDSPNPRKQVYQLFFFSFTICRFKSSSLIFAVCLISNASAIANMGKLSLCNSSHPFCAVSSANSTGLLSSVS